MAFKQFKKLFIAVSDLTDPDNLLRIINQLQTNIENSITPLANKTQNDSSILTNIQLKSGQTNIVNHTLNRDLVGWKVIRQRSQANTWDSQDANKSPNLTLLLHTSADVTVDLEVF